MDGIYSFLNLLLPFEWAEFDFMKNALLAVLMITPLFGLTGTGYFDMVAYEKFNNGEMTDYIPTDEELAVGFAGLPKVE